MPDQPTKQAAGTAPPQVVKKLLYALRDEHYDLTAAAFHDDVVVGGFWSPPSHLNVCTARRAIYGCAYVLDAPHEPASTCDWKAEDVA
jgi:hypothetical protein